MTEWTVRRMVLLVETAGLDKRQRRRRLRRAARRCPRAVVVPIDP